MTPEQKKIIKEKIQNLSEEKKEKLSSMSEKQKRKYVRQLLENAN